MLKRIFPLLIAITVLLLCSCTPYNSAKIASTTLPVYEFTSRICEGTDLTVTRLVTESVSCLHDYTLKTQQMRAIEEAELVILSGAGLEEFLEDALHGAKIVVDSSEGLTLMEEHHHEEEHKNHHGHVHAEDPHIWLSPRNAKIMADNICQSLCSLYPEHEEQFRNNLSKLHADLDVLQRYGEEKLGKLNSRELITFHDGFSYLAESFDLHILHAIEEESGSEASAADLISIIRIVQEHQLPAIFTEINGSVSAADIIAAETGSKVFALDMAISGESYFDSMYRNIDTLWEALQ